MKHNKTEHSRGWSRRARGALGALVIAASALAVTASAVSAIQAAPGRREEAPIRA